MKSSIDYMIEQLSNDPHEVMETACNADVPGEELSELAAFDVAVEEFLEHMDSLLLSKNEAYSTDEDRFFNFTTGASVLGCSKEKAAWAYAAKHIASISKMVKDPDKHSLEEWLEKCGDLANYTCLIYAMRYSKVKNEQRR